MWYAQIQETLTLFQLISASSCKVTTSVYKSGEFTVDMPPMYKVFKDRQAQTKAVDELTEGKTSDGTGLVAQCTRL